MVDGVHGNTTSLGPRVALDSELVLSTRRLHERLVGPATSSNNSNHSTDGALDDLLGTGWELDASLALIRVVSDNSHVVSGGPAEGTSVANLLLHVADNGTFWDGSEGKDVSDGERGVLAGVDELAGVHALVGDEGLGVELVSVWVAENDLGEWCAAAGIVDNVLYNTTNVSMALGEIVGAELGRGLVEALRRVLVYRYSRSSWLMGMRTGVRGEDGPASLPLVANNTTL